VIILLNFQLKKTVDELNNAMEAKEELMQRCHELDLQVFQLVLINVFTLVVHPPIIENLVYCFVELDLFQIPQLCAD